MSGKVTYNGQSLEEFTPQRTSAYASQQDLHISEMTVREVLEFAGYCQGAGFKHGKHHLDFQFSILKAKSFMHVCYPLLNFAEPLACRNAHGTS